MTHPYRDRSRILRERLCHALPGFRGKIIVAAAGEHSHACSGETVRTAEHDGRLRKYYTTAGLRRIEESKAEWQEVISIYRFVTKEESHG